MPAVLVWPFLLAGCVLGVGCYGGLGMYLRLVCGRSVNEGVDSREKLLRAKQLRSDAATLGTDGGIQAALCYWVELLTGVDELRHWYRLWCIQHAQREPDCGHAWWHARARASSPVGDTVADFPRRCMQSYLSHHDVSRLLAGFCTLAGAHNSTPLAHARSITSGGGGVAQSAMRV